MHAHKTWKKKRHFQIRLWWILVTQRELRRHKRASGHTGHHFMPPMDPTHTHAGSLQPRVHCACGYAYALRAACLQPLYAPCLRIGQACIHPPNAAYKHPNRHAPAAVLSGCGGAARGQTFAFGMHCVGVPDRVRVRDVAEEH